MALVECPECRRTISDRAAVCPACGTFGLSPSGRSDATETIPDHPPPLRQETVAATAGWSDGSPHPWRRLFARLLDTSLHGMFGGIMLAALIGIVDADRLDDLFAGLESRWGRVLDQMLSLYLAVPINATFLGFTGTTLGKWIFGVRVLDSHGRVLGFRRALERELRVIFRGMAAGVPILMLFGLGSASRVLRQGGRTPWDESMQTVVSHRNGSSKQIVLVLAGGLLFIVLRIVTEILAAS